MAKQSFTHYYVQVQREGENPQIVYHTYVGIGWVEERESTIQDIKDGIPILID